MTSSNEDRFIVRAGAGTAVPFSHPLNERSEIHFRPLSRLTGMSRLGISHATIPPGRESFIYHSHHREEEFIYILSGRGVAEIDGQTYEVGAGDFMAFPTPSVAHHLSNPFDEDLVYLTGGENLDMEIADFPHLRKRMYRCRDRIDLVDHDAIQDWPTP